MVDVDFTATTVSRVITDTIQSACASAPLIVGYSLGGYVAMQYAARHPERTAALALAGCAMDYEGWRRWPYEMSARLSEAMPSYVLDAFAHYSLHLVLPKTVAEVVEHIPFNRSTFARTAAIARGEGRFSDLISTYRKPVLFIQGEYDLVFRMDERRFLSRLPQARLRVIKHADHTAALRRPQEIANIVADFAASVFR